MKTVSAILTFFFIARLPEVFACVGCRAPGTAGPYEPQTITAGIALSWGVIGMLGVVFVIISGLVYYIVDTCQKLDRQNSPQ